MLFAFVFFSCFLYTMDALSNEWRRETLYRAGDRVAFKLKDSIGVAAFECITPRTSTFPFSFENF